VLILQIQGSKIWHLYNGADVPPHQMRRREPVDYVVLPIHRGSGSSVTRRVSWPRCSPTHRAGWDSTPRLNAPHGFSALIRLRSRP
jgi:hypothetical protein